MSASSAAKCNNPLAATVSVVFALAILVFATVLLKSSKLIPSKNSPSQTDSEKQFSETANEQPTRRLPQAIIIGVKKGGTRALLEYLRLHPNVSAPGPEIHFFDRYYSRGLEWYRKQMPATTPTQLTIEKTPCYFVKREVPARIYRMSPDTKLLVVVRDPVTRAISDYTQSFSKGRTTRKFSDMVFPNPASLSIDQTWSAIRIGIYEKHLRKWLPYFPLEQIHFVSGENLIRNPVQEMKLVEGFLGLLPFIDENYFSFNSTKGFPCVKRRLKDSEFRCLGKTKGRSHPRVSNRTLMLLKNFYRSYNQDFFDAVGRDFGWNSQQQSH